MQEELNEIETRKVWKLVPRLKEKSVIGTKWAFRKKLDKEGNVVRNKARLVVQGYNHEEGTVDETFAPIARLEAIRMLCAFVCFKSFLLYQMDVKSAFFNLFRKEEYTLNNLLVLKTLTTEPCFQTNQSSLGPKTSALCLV